jgi:hypothetical protein
MDGTYMEVARKFTGRLHKEFFLERGYTSETEALDETDEVYTVDGGGVAEEVGVGGWRRVRRVCRVKTGVVC